MPPQMSWPTAIVLAVGMLVTGFLVFKGLVPVHYVLVAAAWLMRSPLPGNGGGYGPDVSALVGKVAGPVAVALAGAKPADPSPPAAPAPK